MFGNTQKTTTPTGTEAEMKVQPAEETKTGTAETKTATLYVCKKKCFYNGVLYNVGDTLYAVSGTDVPEHFQKAE